MTTSIEVGLVQQKKPDLLVISYMTKTLSTKKKDGCDNVTL